MPVLRRVLSHACLLAAGLLLASSAVADPRDDRAPEAPPPSEPVEQGSGGAGGKAAVTGGSGGGRRDSDTSRPRPPKKRRGGINPCMTPDPGWGKYDKWQNVSIGQMVAPKKGGITKKGSFDVLIHFHGHEPIRKEFVKTANGVVLVGIDLGIGSGAYQNVFSAPNAFTNLLESVESAMSKKTGKEARVRKIGLSAWSAGYGAIEQILRQPAGKRIDAVVLLDSVHAGYADESKGLLKENQLEPFVQFARKATKSNKFMFLSHSSIIPPGYASTAETAGFIIEQVNGKQKKASRKDVLGLDMFTRYDRGDFHVRGYTGDDKPDHCAHIGLIAKVLKNQLQPRWKTPSAR
jgi:hypothetical protein